VVLLWWCFSCGTSLVVLLWWYFSGGTPPGGTSLVVLLWWYFSGGTSLVVLLRWCFFGGISLVVFLWWYLSCGTSLVVLLLWYFDGVSGDLLCNLNPSRGALKLQSGPRRSKLQILLDQLLASPTSATRLRRFQGRPTCLTLSRKSATQPPTMRDV